MSPTDLIELLQVFAHPGPRELSAMRALLSEELILPAADNDWHVTERGQAFVEFLCDLPLPEQVAVWRVGDLFTKPLRVHATLPSAPPATSAVAEGLPPPPAPPARRINGITVPDDPEQKRVLGLNLLNNGMGVGEVAELLGVSFAEADSYFTGK